MLLVFGSINLDLAFRTALLPQPGQTVLGHGLLISPGGKGANQAHAAARDGARTTLVAAVGSDAMANAALPLLRAAGVDLSALQRLPGSTGCASIAVDDAGQNQIIVAPGVNLALRHEAVSDDLLKAQRAVLLQMETDPGQNLTVLQRARAAGCLTLLNNAPAQALGDEMRGLIDVLIVNQGELLITARAAGLGTSGLADGSASDHQHDSTDRLARLLRALAPSPAHSLVLTRGAQGALAWHQGELWQAPALPVVAVDTTGAGDTFCGVLAAALARGWTMAAALQRACVAASLACRAHGAQSAQPDALHINRAQAT